MVSAVTTLAWTALFSPFLAALLILFFAMRSPRAAGGAALAGILISFAASAALFFFCLKEPVLPFETSTAWIRIADFKVDFGFLLDRLSVLMLLVVTGVGSCIFFYSVGYMKGDTSVPRYFACLSFFAFSMVGIVLSNNFLMLFVFWELVAVSSYLLIGFWFEKPSAADAGNKAFIVNRVGDFGFVIGIFYLWTLSGAGGAERSFSFTHLSQFIPDALQSGTLTTPMLAAASLLVFCGVVGKSAQFPLYIWLPDAMEGPTPVSALIHAATMVAAGVYLLSRSFFLVSGIGQALEIIAVTGAVTAGLAALLAVVQNDIKKILAYSTVSQLGYMVMAVGLGSSAAAMYHLTTHAFFKALLFLGAGAMIHALHTQDIWEMGGLLKKMPVTAVTFLVGALALCGIWPLSGFFSKDEILSLAREHRPALYWAALLTAALTAFYMSRAAWIAVLRPKESKAHDAPPVMKIPLLILAAFSAGAGFMGIPGFILGGDEAHAGPPDRAVALASSIAAAAGLVGGSLVYANPRSGEDPLKRWLGGIYGFLVKKYYLDDFFYALARLFQAAVAGILFRFDRNVVIGRGVNGAARATAELGAILRRLQTGRVQNYATAFSLGVAALVFFVIMKAR